MLRVVVLILFAAVFAMAQVAPSIPERSPDGGGSSHLANGPCLTAEQYQELHAALKAQVAALTAEGKWRVKKDAQRPVLTSPLKVQDQVKGYQTWGISNYLDQNTTYPGDLLDYNGGQRTYDLATGYNHQGIDFSIWPYSWDMMNKREVAVVAAAPGTIVFRRESEPDMNCFFVGQARWNAVFIRHDDGSTAWYGHLAKDTLTEKSVGDRVARGEHLGFVGSSGFSTGPHLHFELYDSEENLIDPFSGPYNFLNEDSWWENQEPYHNSYIVKMLTHSDIPAMGLCHSEEVPHFKNVFARGEQARLAVYYRDQLGSQITTHSIVDPTGTEIAKWTHNPNEDHYALSWWFWGFVADDSNPDGVYLWRASYLDKLTQHAFGVGDIGDPVFDDFSLDKAVISPGEQVSVTWATSGVLELYLDQGHGEQFVDGSITLSPASTAIYTLTAKGPGGEIQKTFEIEVLAHGEERMLSHVTPDNTAFITEFILANKSESDLSYEMQPYDVAGNALEVVTGTIVANQTQHLTKTDLFGDAPVSHFAIQADEQIALSASYRSAAGGSPAHLTDAPLQTRRWRVYTGDWSIIWDGLAVVNRGNAETDIFVAQLDGSGNEIKTEPLGKFAPNAKALAVLASLGFTNTPGTHFVIYADQNLALTALRGQLSDALYLWENKAIVD